MTITTRWIFGLALLLLLAPWARGAIDTRCLADGGVSHCPEPTIVANAAAAPVDLEMWTYGLCDMAGAFPWRQAAWVKVLGGKPVFEKDIGSASSAFEQIVHSACALEIGSVRPQRTIVMATQGKRPGRGDA